MRRLLTNATLGLFLALGISSCGEPSPDDLPVRNTPAGAKVNLSGISLVITNSKLTSTKEKHVLSFDYTLDNTSGAHLAFLCLYPNTDDLIDVSITDAEGETVRLGKSKLDGLTLAEPRPLKVSAGKTTRSFSVPVLITSDTQGDVLRVRARFHAPSRYDELRSSLTAPIVEIPMPINPRNN